MKSMFISILMSFILLVACKKDKTPLTVDINDPFTSHEYVWQIDTLKAPDALQVMMSDVWGTDENNVWVVGHSDDARYQLWHWDGNDWENIRLLFSGHPHSFTAIHGFSENDIWIVGNDIQNYPNIIHRDFIIHFDGNDWEHITGLNAPQSLSVWGSDPNNVFVGCDSGIVLYYDGNKWEKERTGTLSRIYSIQGFSSNQVYAAGWTIDQMPYDTTFYYFFEYDGSDWKVVNSYIDYPYAPPGVFGYKLWISPEGKLYNVGNDGLYLRENNTWIRMRDEKLLAIHGTGWNNIFSGGWANQLFHFNGDDWFLYEDFLDNSILISAIWCNETNVFVIGRPHFQSLIYRGILKE